jgi:hypothetical protein
VSGGSEVTLAAGTAAAVEAASESCHSAAFDAFATGALFCKAGVALGDKLESEANKLFLGGHDRPLLLVKPHVFKASNPSKPNATW